MFKLIQCQMGYIKLSNMLRLLRPLYILNSTLRRMRVALTLVLLVSTAMAEKKKYIILLTINCDVLTKHFSELYSFNLNNLALVYQCKMP